MSERTAFPVQGRPREELGATLERMRQGDADWRHGRVPLYVFGSLPEVEAVGRDAYAAYFTENALGARRAFASLGRMESDVIGMSLDLFQAPEEAAGSMTSGGSESILLAVKACRDHARARRDDAAFRGNLVLPETAHPAFDKAARLMDLPVRRVRMSADFRADWHAMAAAIDQDTMMLVGSVPCFPFGVIDPIADLSELARSRGLWLHVDACVGGYLAPFARAAGSAVPAFDFSLQGVASLSADLHKFGFCPKPASVILFRDQTYADFAGFDLDVWPSGRFRTGTLVGTRPGGAVAGAWAVLNYLGRDGYTAIAARLIAMRKAYVEGIEAIAPLRVFGRPDLTIFAFGAPGLDMAAVAGAMATRGWVPGMTSKPPGMHIMASLLHEAARPDYLADLAGAVALAPLVEGQQTKVEY